MAKRAASESQDFVEIGGIRWPVLGAEAMATLCGFSSDMLRQLERAGRFRKVARDRYSPPDVFAGVLAHMRDEERRSTKSNESRRVLEARAREIEIRTAEREGKLIEADDMAEHVAMILQAFRSELAGVSTEATRDLDLRAAIEAPLERAIARLRDSFARESAVWGKYAAKLADERIAALETSLKGAAPPGESVVETAAAAVRAARSKPPARTTKRTKR